MMGMYRVDLHWALEGWLCGVWWTCMVMIPLELEWICQ